MSKDFQAGDKVTVVYPSNTFCGEIGLHTGLKSHSDGHCNVWVLFDYGRDGKWVHRNNVYHGHNVTVEVMGEELPERLRLERVSLPLSCCDQRSDVCMYVIELPAPLAKQVREYFEGRE